MKTTFYKIECLTNLHVGSGDVNYNIVDNEVEKDSVTGLPVIHASGIKGALRDAVKASGNETVNKIFGMVGNDEVCKGGTHKFFDAGLIARPMRVAKSSSMASIPVVSVASVNAFLSMLNAFGCNHYGVQEITAPDFGDNQFLTNATEQIEVEGEKTGVLTGETKDQLAALENVIGSTVAIVKDFDGYDLPVVARNHLENGISKNLWYEEVVPHGSVFYFSIIAPDDDESLKIPDIVQFGGHASIGCGFTKVTKL